MSLLAHARTLAGGRRIALGLGVTALAVTGVAGLASAALFTDTTSVNGSNVTTGTVKLGVAPASTVWSVGGVAPGWSGTYGVQVDNAGSLALRYAVTASSTNPDAKALAGQLDAAVVAASATSACAGADYVTAPAFSGKLSGLSLGNPAAGPQAGDRQVSAASGEVLCVRLSMPKTTNANDNLFQGATTVTTLTFDAEQVVNNP